MGNRVGKSDLVVAYSRERRIWGAVEGSIRGRAKFSCAYDTPRTPRQAGDDPPPLKWSDLRYVFDIQEDCNGKEAIQA